MISKIKYIIIGVILIIFLWMYYTTIHSFQVEINSKNSMIKKLEEEIASFNTNESIGGAETPIENNFERQDNFIFPILEEDYLITSPYGIRVSPILDIEMKHQGLDIAAAYRSQVVAIDDGVIIEHWPPPGTPYPNGGSFRGHPIYGGMVLVEHEDGFRSLYAHLSWTRVYTGYEVSQGEVIGRVGSTGQSVGEHLHLEILYENESVNPLLYIDSPN